LLIDCIMLVLCSLCCSEARKNNSMF